MDKLEIQKLRDIPIEGVAERLGLKIRQHKCLCPFHDDHHASLSFHVRRNTYRCFVCGASGGTIDLAMNLLKSSGRGSFREACRWLADENNVILTEYTSTLTSNPSTPTTFDASRYERFFEHPWLSDTARRFLFDERMLDERVVHWCRLTSWRDRKGVNWLQIPYYDVDGKLIGIQNRNLGLSPVSNPSCASGSLPREGGERGFVSDPSCASGSLPREGGGRGSQDVGERGPRFRFPQGSRCTIYNLPVLRLLRPDDDLYITEGCSDCWAMLSSGRKAIAIPSATLMKDDDVTAITRHLTPHTRLHMFPDNDEPGERLFLQLKSRLPDLQHHHLPLGCKDFAEYYVLTKKKGQTS